MQIKYFLLFLFSLVCASLSAQPYNTENTEFTIKSKTYSNILPSVQLLKDKWHQVPNKQSNYGFSQSEMSAKYHWKNIIFTVAQRLDYFVKTTPDTALAFYLAKKDKQINDKYALDLTLFHQRSNGFRLGYQWQWHTLTSRVHLGYWKINSSRNTILNGYVNGDENNKISGKLALTENYTHRNYFRRPNNNNWNNNGKGITFDMQFDWQISQNMLILLEVNDLYSKFSQDNLGFSQGVVDTEGTYINNVGGKAYLPLYQGVESQENFNFNLPKYIKLTSRYQYDGVTYIGRYKKQANTDFYYLGFELDHGDSKTQYTLDLKHLAPSINYKNNWISSSIEIDHVNINKSMQLNLGISLYFTFL